MAASALRRTEIPGLLVLDLPLHADSRGWFKENWQREKMMALGLPDFRPVQHNIAFNEAVGVTRGVHAEPWDKLVSLTSGRIFGAWVDLREGPGFGTVVQIELGPDIAVFIPHGVGNAYQTLEAGTTYSYLVNRHWSAEATGSYTFANLADPQLGIGWPIPLERSVRSEADLKHPPLRELTPVRPRRTVVLGAGGQVATALTRVMPAATFLTQDQFDLTRPEHLASYPWADVEVVVNAAAYTAVDAAETDQGRRDCWAVNVTGLSALVETCRRYGITLVNFSTDYVFDGVSDEVSDGVLDGTRGGHDEDEPFSPLGVYGQTKAAGDALVATWDRHYTIRTSWVVGEGKNFVATMVRLARSGASPRVVDDQCGRLSFTEDLAEGVLHLLTNDAPHGTYNLTSAGPVQSWADIAADVFERCGRSRADVTPVTTAEYEAGAAATTSLAPRPRCSALSLAKITATGFTPGDAASQLDALIGRLVEGG